VSDFQFEEEEFSTQFNGKTILRILAQTKPHWKWMVGFLIAIACTAGVDSYFTFLGKRIVDDGIVAGNREALLQILLLYAGLVVLQSAFVFSFIYLAGVLGERVRYDLRQKMFNHLQDLSLSYYSRTPVGWIMSRVTSDSDRVAELVTWGLLDVTWAVMSISSATIFMLIINWRLALIVLALMPILVIVAIQFRKKILVEFRNVRKLNSKDHRRIQREYHRCAGCQSPQSGRREHA
jgi:ATP-binding cassette, subfamily B, bacterial